ncbi:DNA repair protein RecN, partial [Frankliniella fusca]
MVAMAFTGLALLAGKALMVSKIALLLSGVVALKKLFSGGHGGHSGSQVEVFNVPNHGRSLDTADGDTLAYRGQIQRPATRRLCVHISHLLNPAPRLSMIAAPSLPRTFPHRQPGCSAM